MQRKRKPIRVKDVVQPGYLSRLRELFLPLHNVGCERDTAGNRRFFFDDYCLAVMLHCFCPAITSARALQELSQYPSAQEKLGLVPFSLSVFSESSAVFKPEMLKEIVANVAAEVHPMGVDPRVDGMRYVVHLVDRTFLKALPKLACTHTTGRDGESKYTWSVLVDLQLKMPACDWFDVKPGRPSEVKGLKPRLTPGCCYVLDRGYQDATFHNAVHAAGSRYVNRVKENLVHQVLKENPVSADDLAAGVISDQWVTIGSKVHNDHPVRLITLTTEMHEKRRCRGKAKTMTSGKMLVLTNLTLEDADAGAVALLYRYRWTIELFFRFLKQVLGMKHPICQRQKGVEIFIYCMVIACLLLYQTLGKKPNISGVRALQFYVVGLTTLEELLGFVQKELDKSSAKTRA